jgi:hypothetical protein
MLTPGMYTGGWRCCPTFCFGQPPVSCKIEESEPVDPARAKAKLHVRSTEPEAPTPTQACTHPSHPTRAAALNATLLLVDRQQRTQHWASEGRGSAGSLQDVHDAGRELWCHPACWPLRSSGMISCLVVIRLHTLSKVGFGPTQTVAFC